MKQEEFERRIDLIFGKDFQLKSRWKGKSSEIEYQCGVCKEKHSIRADSLLSRNTVCKKTSLVTNKKWSQEDFEKRVEAFFPNKLQIDEWHGITGKLIYHCKDCGTEYSYNTARCLLSSDNYCEKCCNSHKPTSDENIDKYFSEHPEFEFVEKVITKKSLQIKMKCTKCNTVFTRFYTNIKTCPNVCPTCNSGAEKQKLPLQEIQKRLDEFEKGAYQILEYKGQLNKSKVRCNKCGFIFNAQMSYFTETTRGCPKCSRFKSKGEKAVEKYLTENNIVFEVQKRFKDCNNNLSSFDFAVYDKNNTMHLIEVDGIQHFKDNSYFEGLEIITKRDKIKNDYCLEKNIHLIRIPYYDLNKIDNYLSFLKGSTTIP